jgi:hypothetical protein
LPFLEDPWRPDTVVRLRVDLLVQLHDTLHRCVRRQWLPTRKYV